MKKYSNKSNEQEIKTPMRKVFFIFKKNVPGIKKCHCFFVTLIHEIYSISLIINKSIHKFKKYEYIITTLILWKKYFILNFKRKHSRRTPEILYSWAMSFISSGLSRNPWDMKMHFLYAFNEFVVEIIIIIIYKYKMNINVLV